MSTQLDSRLSITPDTFGTPAGRDLPPEAFDDASWELDVSIVESGPEADRLIRMTDDGCGQSCQSACTNTCP